jgi:hypothetical protein
MCLGRRESGSFLLYFGGSVLFVVHHTSKPYICLFVSCVSINVLEMLGEWLVFGLFWRVCTGIYICCTILMYLYSMQQSYKLSSARLQIPAEFRSV